MDELINHGTDIDSVDKVYIDILEKLPIIFWLQMYKYSRKMPILFWIPAFKVKPEEFL